MPFKIAVVNKLCKNVLHKCGHCAGVEAQLLFIYIYKVHWQHHIPDTQRRRNRFGKCVQIYDVVVLGECEQGFRRLCGNGKLGFKIVLDNVALAFACPADVFVALGCRRRNSAGVASVWRCVQNICRRFGKRLAVYTRLPQRQQLAADLRCLINLLYLFVRGRLYGKYAVSAEKLHNKPIQVFRAGADNYLLCVDRKCPCSF